MTITKKLNTSYAKNPSYDYYVNTLIELPMKYNVPIKTNSDFAVNGTSNKLPSYMNTTAIIKPRQIEKNWYVFQHIDENDRLFNIRSSLYYVCKIYPHTIVKTGMKFYKKYPATIRQSKDNYVVQGSSNV